MSSKRKFSTMMSGQKEGNNESSRLFKLDVEAELRFEVEDKSKVTLQVKSGLAEVFGTELVKNKRYIFTSGAKVAVFTWHGCTLELTGETEVAYVAKQTPMNVYINIHGALEQMRQRAEEQNTKGPTVLVVGSTGVGKSTLCRILLNYAARLGRKPIFADLDVSQGQISVPGTIGALLVGKPADVEEGFSQQAPLVYHFGHISPANDSVLYSTLVSRLSEAVRNKAERNRKAETSGVIIDTFGFVKGDGYKTIIHAAVEFEVDVLLVIENERLCNDLEQELPRFVKVLRIPKSAGVVERTQSVKAKERYNRVHEYFYGLKLPLYPHAFRIKFSDVKVYEIETVQLPDSCLPLGFNIKDNTTRLVPALIGQNLLNRVLSVSFATNIEDVIQTNVIGFICVSEVDTEKQTLTVLSPQRQPLPKSILLTGDVQFTDSD